MSYKKRSKFIYILFRRYQVDFPIPWNLCIHGNGNKNEPAVITGNVNPNCRIMDFNVEKDNLRYNNYINYFEYCCI